MKLKHIAAAAATVTLGALCGPAQAALFDRGNGLIYDDTLDITWLQDWNYAKTSGYDADGQMTWDEAVTWADQLSVAGYSDWRLPSAYLVKGMDVSELESLYYDTLGNPGLYCPTGHPICSAPLVIGFDQTGPFANTGPFYWTGDAVAAGSYPGADAFAYEFDTGIGYTHSAPKSALIAAVAVRNGDVAAVTAVPEPETYALMLMGLGALAVVARRRSR